MGLLDKFARVREQRQSVLATGVDPFHVPVEAVHSATRACIDGHEVILAGTNNYLGLTFDETCREAAHRAIEACGTGTTGSPLANGSYGEHRALERELAQFFGKQHGLLFATGYQANLGMLATLAGPGDVILLDSDCHASIYDGCRLGGADIVRFRHNDPDSLDKRLRRLGDRAANALIVVEGLYSMLGDTAPLARITELKRDYGAYLMVDEAHSLGVYGATGQGLAEALGVSEAVDFIVGTFSKSLAGVGGFCVSDHAVLETLRYASRPYIFTASPAPSVVAGVRAALQALRQRPELRRQLWENAEQLYRALEARGYELGPEVSPVIAVVLGTPEQALGLWQGLFERGVYANLVLPPAAPEGKALLRCSVSAAHTPEEIGRIGEAFAQRREDVAAMPSADER